MKSRLEKTKEKLFSTGDNAAAFSCLRLLNSTLVSDEALLAILEYAESGKLTHPRNIATAMLVDQNLPPEIRESAVGWFLKGLKDANFRYWSIKGIAKHLGTTALEQLYEIAMGPQFDHECRSLAIQELSILSAQPFSRGLPRDPGKWSESQWRLEEIIDWKKQNFPRGNGCSAPAQSSLLHYPVSAVDKAASAIEEKFAKIRSIDYSNPVDPANYLVLGDQDEIEKIKRLWELPLNYLHFLECFSPFNILAQLHLPKIEDDVSLYGSKELIKGQVTYAVSATGETLHDWPISLLVIAHAWGDPFVLDLSQSTGIDAPVLTAEHDSGAWNFKQFSKSFVDFLSLLSVH